MKTCFSITLDEWKRITPFPQFSNFTNDLRHLKRWYTEGQDHLTSLPLPIERTDEHRRIARSYRDVLAETRSRFVARYGLDLYAEVTDGWTEFVRVEELIYRIADHYPGLAPTKKEIQEDMALELKHKHGHELSQGLILGELLAISEVGKHLMAAMRQPKVDSLHNLAKFQSSGEVEFGGIIKLVRKNNAAYLTLSNCKYLNAEDDEQNVAMESAVDLVLLDPNIEIGIIRGDLMEHEKYRGRRVFCSGINLTKLYRGKLSYMFYVSRELGLISKIFRGLLGDSPSLGEAPDRGCEKPWISVVDSHAIGGGCQLVLVSDYVIAESSAYFTLPARTEGFIPGLANLRLPRFMGQRLANQMIYQNYKVIADSEEGRKLADEVVDSSSMNDAIDRVIKGITQTGVQGMISNRKAFRHGAEPLNVFCNYMATFCRQQAICMHDETIIRNLEYFWINRSS
jgi:thioesterase DpgC